MMVRYCRRCDTEFQPHIVRCSDCGGELEDRDPESDAAVAEHDALDPAAAEADTAAGEFVAVATDLTSEKAERVARRLGDAGIPFRVGAHGYGFTLAVREQDKAAARPILLRARAIPREPQADQPAVAESGGPCPACGDPVAAGAKECPGCGLSLSSEAAVCDRCGAELADPWRPCPRCRGADPDA